MNKIFQNKESVEALVGNDYEVVKEVIENPTEADVEEFLELVEDDIQERLNKQVEDFGYILYSASQIEDLRKELQDQPVYRLVYEVGSEKLPKEDDLDKIVERSLFGGVSDEVFLKRLREFMASSPLTQSGVAKQMGMSATHFGEVLRGNRKVTQNFRVRTTKVLSNYGFK